MNSDSELSETSMNKIRSKKWAEDLMSSMQDKIKNIVVQWSLTAMSLGEDEGLISEWTTTFLQHYDVAGEEVMDDIQAYKAEVITQIEEYLTKLQSICKLLHEEMPNVGENQLGLLKERNQLRTLVEEYDSRYNKRLAEVNALMAKESKLCYVLGIQPKPITNDRLPTPAQLEKLHSYIESLENERFVKEEQYLKLKSEIQRMIQELNRRMDADLERTIISEEVELVVSAEKIKTMEAFHAELSKEIKEIKEEIESLWYDIESAWDTLEIDRLERERFRTKNAGNSIATLAALKKERKRYEQLKKDNIKIFVEKYRKNLDLIWNACHASEEQKNSFKFYDIESYSEDLLELFELEIKKWETYYSNHKKLINFLNEHQKLWNNMLLLENNATGSNRYRNRGGQLLKEEKERNKLAKKIPLIEQQLLEMAEEFQSETGRVFLTYGATVEEYIAHLHNLRENDKKLKLSAHKQKRDQSVTPVRKCALSLFQATSTHSLMTPVSPAKRKILPSTPLSINKKPKLIGKKENVLKNSTNTPGSSRKLKVLGSRTKRASIERQHRIKKLRRSSTGDLQKENISIASDYADFEGELSSGKVGRSTMQEPEIVRRTPKRQIPEIILTNATQSPRSARKLAVAAPSVKLIF